MDEFKKKIKEINKQFYIGIWKTERERERVMKARATEERKGFMLFMLSRQMAELYTMWANKCKEIKNDYDNNNTKHSDK